MTHTAISCSIKKVVFQFLFVCFLCLLLNLNAPRLNDAPEKKKKSERNIPDLVAFFISLAFLSFILFQSGNVLNEHFIEIVFFDIGLCYLLSFLPSFLLFSLSYFFLLLSWASDKKLFGSLPYKAVCSLAIPFIH